MYKVVVRLDVFVEYTVKSDVCGVAVLIAIGFDARTVAVLGLMEEESVVRAV